MWIHGKKGDAVFRDTDVTLFSFLFASAILQWKRGTGWMSRGVSLIVRFALDPVSKQNAKAELKTRQRYHLETTMCVRLLACEDHISPDVWSASVEGSVVVQCRVIESADATVMERKM